MFLSTIGFYTIPTDYLEYLHGIDSEVYYNPSYGTTIKPFVGIIIVLGEYKYFVPLSSAKPKHRFWKNVSDEHFLIYEFVPDDLNYRNHVYKPASQGKKIHVLSVLDFKKMIPVPDGLFSYIEFDTFDDSYRDLFQKEYQFCLNIKDKLLKKIEKMYHLQESTGVVKARHCNFKKLEKACNNFSLSENE